MEGQRWEWGVKTGQGQAPPGGKGTVPPAHPKQTQGPGEGLPGCFQAREDTEEMRPKEMQNLCSLKIGSLWPEFILASYHECRVELRPRPRPGEATRMSVVFLPGWPEGLRSRFERGATT